MKKWTIEITEDDQGVFHATINGHTHTVDPREFADDSTPRDAAVGDLFATLADTFDVE